jgi:predicted outer membrane repeat protein
MEGPSVTNDKTLIQVYSKGRLEMKDTAKISGNITNADGGGVSLVGATTTIAADRPKLILSGNAEISGNKATSTTANRSGGGVYAQYADLILSGAGGGNPKITANEVFASETFRKSYGGGIYLDNSTLTMDGGEISGNIASGYTSNGGGVYIDSNSTLTLSGNGKIIENYTGTTSTSTTGGGVYAAGTLLMSGGEISRNYATTGNGGGVYAAGTFTMSGGKIEENYLTFTTTGSGSGVFVSANATFTLSGSAVVTPKEGGQYLAPYNSPRSDNRNSIFLYSDTSYGSAHPITIDGILSAAKVGLIDVKQAWPAANPVIVSKTGNFTNNAPVTKFDLGIKINNSGSSLETGYTPITGTLGLDGVISGL